MDDHSRLTLEQCKKLEAKLVAKRDELRRALGLPAVDEQVAKLHQQLWGG